MFLSSGEEKLWEEVINVWEMNFIRVSFCKLGFRVLNEAQKLILY